MDNFDFADEIWNYYGSLCVAKKDEKYYWDIDDGPEAEIPEYLYKALKKYRSELDERNADDNRSD